MPITAPHARQGPDLADQPRAVHDRLSIADDVRDEVDRHYPVAQQRVAVAQAAVGFKVLTTVGANSFSDPMYTEIADAFPGQKLLDRTSMNTWEDTPVIEHFNTLGQDRIVLSGL